MNKTNGWVRLSRLSARRWGAAFVAIVYGATNVVFCHAAEANFWSARRSAAHRMGKSAAAPLPSPTDALVLAQLPGGARLDFQGPVESSVIPSVPPKEHFVGGKVPVFAGDLPRWLADVVAPYGNMRDVYLSKRSGAPLVIQVQDLHDSSEAQRNIAGLVEALQDERGVSLVGLEGAQGAFATEAFRSFPDADITKAVAEHFMEQGYLGGPEFAGITAKRMPLLWGVEDMNAYKANVAAVKDAAINRPAVELFLEKARRALNEVKDRRLSVRLLTFDKHLTGYHSRKEPLGAYVRYLLKTSPGSTPYVPNLVLLQEALHWEDTLDFKRIEVERTALLGKMVSALSKANLDRLVARSAMYRLGRVSYGDYYRYLRTLCDESGIALDEYTQLSAYVRYVLLAERINRNDLLNELNTLEMTVQDGLAVTAQEKRIVNAARHLALLERLVQHAYTPADWVYHMSHESEILSVGAAIESLGKEAGLPEGLSPPTADALKPFEDFCLQALARNGAMVKNLLEKMNAERRTTAVLVAGGFHTDGLTQLLRQKDISYAVVTPKINGSLPDGHRTLDLLARDPAPLEKLFAGETVNIPLARMVGESNGGNPLVAKLRTAMAVFLLAIFVGFSNEPVQPQAPSAVAAAHIAREEVAKAVPDERGVIVTFSGNGVEGSYLAQGASPSNDGSTGIQPAKIKITPVASALIFSAQFKEWGKNLSGQSVIVWNFIIALLGSLTRKSRTLPKLLLFFGVTYSSAAVSATGPVVAGSALLGWGVLALTVVGLWGIIRFSKTEYGKKIGARIFELKMKFPGVFFFLGGVVKSIAFPSIGLLIIPALAGGMGLPPAFAWILGIFWATAVFWGATPFGRSFREGFSLTKFGKELRSEYRGLYSRLPIAFITSGVFVVGLISGVWTAIFIAAGANALLERFRPRGPPGDPFRPVWMGYVSLLWLLLTTPVEKIHIASGDGDDFSSLNGLIGKEMVGIAPGGTLSKKILFSKQSLFWTRRIKLAKIGHENGFRINRGAGGDEYFVVAKGPRGEITNSFKKSVKAFNLFGLVKTGDDGKLISNLPKIDDLNLRPREVIFTFSVTLKYQQINALKNWPPSIQLGLREGKYILSVDREMSDLSIEELKKQISSIVRVGTDQVTQIDWNAPDGVAVFTTSVGSLSVYDVIRILIVGSNQAWFKDNQKSDDRINKFKELESQWLKEGGRVRWTKIPEIIVWAFRLANDALKIAKTGSLTKDGPIKTGKQRKNQAYSLTDDDIVEMGLNAVSAEAIVKTRKQWWRGLFRFGRWGVDSLTGMLTLNVFHQRLKDSNPQFMYRLDIARYADQGPFFERRGFHNRQGNNYEYGNDLIRQVGASLGVVLDGVELIARSGPDTYYIASNKEITAKELNRLVAEIKKNLDGNIKKDQTGENDVRWDPYVALYEVDRSGFLQSGGESEKWPFVALKQLDQMADAVKVLGEEKPLGQVDLQSLGVQISDKAVRFSYPNNPGDLTNFENKVEKPAEKIIGNRSKDQLGTSSQGKAGYASMILWGLVGVGLILRLNGIEWGDMATLAGGMGLGTKNASGKKSISQIIQKGENAPSASPRVEREGHGQRSEGGFEIPMGLAAIKEKRDRLVKALGDSGGDRLNRFRQISELRYLPPSKNSEKQIQYYMNRVLRQMAIPGSQDKKNQAADVVLFEAAFFEKLEALEELLENKRQGSKYLNASEKALALTATLIFVPLASRLGWNDMADQIADIAFELLEPEAHDQIKNDLLRGMKFSTLEEMDLHAVDLGDNLSRAAKGLLGDHVYVRVRRKRLYSIAAKLRKKSANYRSAGDINDAFNAVVVFTKRRIDPNWKITQGLLYNQFYAVLKAIPIEGYTDGRDPKDSYEPKGREDIHVLFRTGHGLIETQFKSWEVFKEYKSKGQVTNRWKKPPHWMYKTSAILKALYNVKNIELEADAHEMTSDVGNNLDGVLRELLPYEFPMVSNMSGTECRVLKILKGRKVLDLISNPELKIGLEAIPKTKAQRFVLSEDKRFPGELDRRSVGQEELVGSPDVFYLSDNYFNGENSLLPSSDFSLRARLSLLPKVRRDRGLEAAHLKLKGILPLDFLNGNIFGSIFRLFMLSPRVADHGREVFESTANSIAHKNGLASLDELYMAWGTDLISSEEIGQNLFDEGKKLLSGQQMDIATPEVSAAIRNMLRDSEQIKGLLIKMPAVLVNCAEMLANKRLEDQRDLKINQLVLGVSVGIISMDTIRSNFPSIRLEEQKTGQTYTFTIRGVDRVGFILRIVGILNENGGVVESISAPRKNMLEDEATIEVKTSLPNEEAHNKVRAALASIPLAESGRMPGKNARPYLLQILHEQDLKPLELALEILQNFDANVTEIPAVALSGERKIYFHLNPKQLAVLESALNRRGRELSDNIIFEVTPLLPSSSSRLSSFVGVGAIPVLFPFGQSSLSLAVIAMLFSFAVGPIVFRWARTRSPFIRAGLVFVLIGFLFFFPMEALAGVMDGVSTGSLADSELWGRAGGLAMAFLGTSMGWRAYSGEAVRLKGNGNGVSKSVRGGVVLRLNPEEPGGDVYPVYSLRQAGDKKEVVDKRVKRQKKRAEEAFAAVRGEVGESGNENDLPGLLQAVQDRIGKPNREINAQAAVAEVFDLAISRTESDANETFRELKKNLIEWLGETHSLEAFYSKRGLSEGKEEEKNSLDNAKEYAWQIIAGGIPGWDGKKEKWESDGVLKNKWDTLEKVINDAKEMVDGTKGENLSAVGALAIMHGGLAIATKNPGRDESKNQRLHEMRGIIVTLIAFLNPQIPVNVDLEKTRFFAALRLLALEKENSTDDEFIKELKTRVSYLIDQNRSAQSAVALVFEDGENVSDNDSKERLLELLEFGNSELEQELNGSKVVVVSEELLSPTDIAHLIAMGFNLAAIVSKGGASDSRGPAAAGQWGIPYITGAGGTNEINENHRIYVNGKTGEVVARSNRNILNFLIMKARRSSQGKNIALLLVAGMLLFFLPPMLVGPLHAEPLIGTVMTNPTGLNWFIAGSAGAAWVQKIVGDSASNATLPSKYDKLFRAVSKEIDKSGLGEVAINAIEGSGGTVLISRGRSGDFQCSVPIGLLEEWGRADSNSPNRILGVETQGGYLRSQLHTAVLARLARFHLEGPARSQAAEAAILDMGLSEGGVRALFEGKQAGQDAIRRLQEARYRTLVSTPLSMRVRDPINSETVFPVSLLSLESIILNVDGYTFDKGANKDRENMRSVAKNLLGNKTVNSNMGEMLWDVAKDVPEEPVGEFRPNALAIKLDGLMRVNNLSANSAREALAGIMLKRLQDWMNTLTNEKLKEFWSALALLIGLDGSLSEGQDAGDKNDKNIHWLRRYFQLLDIRILTNLSYVEGEELNKGPELAEHGMAAFNKGAAQSAALRNPLQALSEGFKEGEDILVYLSPSMALGKKGELNPEEKTQVELINLLAERLMDSNDREAVEWKTKGKRIVLAVLDPDGNPKSYGDLNNIPAKIISLGVKKEKLFALMREAGARSFKLETAVFSADHVTRSVNAKSEFDKLKLDRVSLYALDVQNVTVDYSEVKDRIASFILALAGGLMCQVAGSLGSKVKGTRLVLEGA